MQISLKSIIREAFNTAYDQYKSGKNTIKESSERLGALLTPEQKTKADQVLNTMVTQSPGWEKYQWSPDASQGLSQKEWNYIIEKIFELYKATGDDKYKQIIGNAYTFSPKITGVGDSAQVTQSALYNAILPKLSADKSSLERLIQKDPDALNNLLSKAWGRIFAGGKIDIRDKKDDQGNIIKQGEKNVDAWQALVKNYNSTDSNFGAYLFTVLLHDTKDLINSEMERVSATKSIDAPNQTTGKSTDLGDEDGNDISDEEEDGIVGGANSDLGDNFDDETSDDNGPTYLATQSQSEEERRRQDKIISNWDNAINEIVNGMKTIPKINERAVVAFEEIMKNYLSYQEIAQKHKDLFDPSELTISILNNKNLKNAADTVLAPYGLDYSIFQNPNWDSEYNGTPRMAAEALDSTTQSSTDSFDPKAIVNDIINLFSSTAKLSTTDKNKVINTFKQYALEHKTAREIAESLGETGEALVKTAILNLTKEEAKASDIAGVSKKDLFYELCYKTLLKYGFPKPVAYRGFTNFNFADYWKAGKEKQREQEEFKNSMAPEDSKYVWEEVDQQFISENFETIIQSVYKRLEKLL